MKLVALKPMRFAGERLEPGAEFEPKRARDANILKAIGKAAEAPPRKAPEPVRKVVEDDDDNDESKRLRRTAAPAPKGRKAPTEYQRRDMRAEE